LGPIPDIPGKDKTCHFLSYLVAGILMLAAFGRVGRFFRPAVLAAGLLVLGCLDEWTQPWVGRSCDFMDWLADAIGIAFVAVAFILCRHFFGRYRATV